MPEKIRLDQGILWELNDLCLGLWVSHGKGVGQRYVNGHCLFNLVFDEVIKTAILKIFGGWITIIDEHGIEFQVNRFAYSDNLCILDSDIDRTCINLGILRTTYSEFGLTISASKTNVMCLVDDSGTEISQVMWGDKTLNGWASSLTSVVYWSHIVATVWISVSGCVLEWASYVHIITMP